MQQLLDEIAAIELRVWRAPQTEAIRGGASAGYKVLWTNGVMSYTDDRPTSPERISELWVRRQCRAGSEYVVIGRYEWARLHWHHDQHKWLTSDPAYSAFSRERAKVRRLLSLAAGSRNAASTNIAVVAGGLASSRLSAADAAAKREELKRLTDAAAREWNGGDLLYQLHVATIAIEREKSTRRKVELARQRRALVRELVARYPDD